MTESVPVPIRVELVPCTCSVFPEGPHHHAAADTVVPWAVFVESVKEFAPVPRAGPYSIGSDIWPGLSKLAEEAGEVVQVVGKLIATGGKAEHWDGANLRQRLEEEIADVVAAGALVVELNGLDAEAVERRAEEKLARFKRWHEGRR
jgi:NTP pyrophosphatase (non-canonical NTP hydrolase)